MLRTSVAAFAMFADAHWGPGVFVSVRRTVPCTTVRPTKRERSWAKFSPIAIWLHD
ncbi:MAG TPA: hypothetical protein VNW50_24675 [Streptosporangiaceae bacterium]|nr:hypothetical protein [Streptosporangiaceae bacterium]